MASGSLGSIFVDLLLRTASFDDASNRLKSNFRGTRRSLEQDAAGAGRAFSGLGKDVDASIAAINSSIRTLGASISGAFAITEIAKYSDVWKQLQGRVSIVTGSLGSVADTQQQLFEIAQKTRQPLEGIVNFYARLNQFIPQAERSQYDLLGVTQSIATALAITGESSESATGAMIQFTQAIGTNFQSAGQELRTLQEQAPRLSIALQNALGGGTKSLQTLKNEGKLTRDSVLTALSSISAEAIKMQDEYAKVPLTIGQAFTRLDNAFLKFIGQSAAISSGTGSIALAVSKLSENFNVLATAVLALGTVFVARMAPAIVGAIGSLVALAAQAVATEVVMAQLAVAIGGGSVTALLSFSVAARAAGAALGLLGGPIGLAIIAAFGAMAIASNKAAAAQEAYNSVIDRSTARFTEFKSASADARKQLIADQMQEIDALQIKLDMLGKIKAAYQGNSLSAWMNTAKDTVKGLNPFGSADTPEATAIKYDKLTLAIKTAKDQLQSMIDLGKQGKIVPGPSDEEIKKINDLYDKNRKYILGVTEAQVRYMDGAKELKTLLDAHKITTSQYSDALQRLKDDTDGVAKSTKKLDDIYEKHRDVILGEKKALLEFQDTQKDLQKLLDAGRISQDEYNAAVGRAQKEYEDSQKAASVWGVDVAETAKQAARNIQDSLADFLFDPFAKGLGGMLTGFEETLRKMVSQMAASEILTGLFGSKGFSAKSSGGLLSGVTSDIGSFFSGFFADGGNIPPGQFGIVGEKGPEIAMGGNAGTNIVPMGGAGMTVNVINNSGGQVSTNKRQGANGLELDVVIDRANAQNISTSGSATRQALKNYQSRSLVKR